MICVYEHDVPVTKRTTLLLDRSCIALMYGYMELMPQTAIDIR